MNTVILMLKNILYTIIGIILSLLLIPVILPLGVIASSFCLLAIWAIKMRFGTSVYKARGTDVVHGKWTERSQPIINVAVRVTGELNYKFIERRMLDLIHNTYGYDGQRRYRRLTELYGKVFGYNVWKKYDNFDIKDHLKVVAVEDGVLTDTKQFGCTTENPVTNGQSQTKVFYSRDESANSIISESKQFYYNETSVRPITCDMEQFANANEENCTNNKSNGTKQFHHEVNTHRNNFRNGSDNISTTTSSLTPERTDKKHTKYKQMKDIYLPPQHQGFKVFGSSNWARFMKKLLDKHGMAPFPSDKPQWEMLLAKNDNKSYTILFRFHHAISDGIYLSRMFCEDMLDEPYILFPRFKQPSILVRLLIRVWSFTLLPFGFWNIISNKDRNPLHGKELSGKKRFFCSDRIPLASIKTIKERSPSKTSIHSIAFSCVSSAIAKHFEKRNFKSGTITALTPIPLQNRSHPIKMKNKFAVGAIRFPVTLTDIKWNPGSGFKPDSDLPALTRLFRVQESLIEMSKNISMLPLNSLINGLCSVLPVTVAESLLSVKGCTVAISHLPGAKTKAKLYNGDVVDHMFWIPDREPMGIGFSIYSYDGHLRAGLLVDEALIDSDEEGNAMMTNFETEIANLNHDCQRLGECRARDQTTAGEIKIIP